MIPLQRRIVQNAFVVNDIEAAAWRWVRTFGVGPFFISRHLQPQDQRYRGTPVAMDFSVAIAQAGEVQIELVQQHDDGPSCYRDIFAAGREGFHHVCVIAEDYDRDLAHYSQQGLVVAGSGLMADMRYCYVDTAAQLGHMVEIVEDKPIIRDYFAMVRAGAETWDGVTDPIRFLS
jgi:hypothetical protein